MKFLRPKRCGVCAAKLSKDVEHPNVRLNTSDGVIELEICEECADFFDRSADIMRKRHEHRNSDSDSQEEFG